MKLGICTGFDNLEKAAAYGFDYIEVGVGSVANLSDEEFAAIKAKIDASPIKVEAANVMLPGPFHVTGKEADFVEIETFLKKAFPRLASLGCKSVVFGSGGARRIPEGFPREDAWKQMVEASKIIAKVAGENGITITLEPLNTKETNIINSVSEGGKLVEEVDHPSFMLLADYYHVGIENEGFGGIMKYGKYLRHTHIAHPVTRTVPKKDDNGNYEGFFAALKEVGYDARVSIEGRVDDFDGELPTAAKYLKSLMNA